MGTDQPPLVGGKLVEKPQPGCYPAIRFVVDRYSPRWILEGNNRVGQRVPADHEAVAAAPLQRDAALGVAGRLEHADAADDLVAAPRHSHLVPDAREVALCAADDLL